MNSKGHLIISILKSSIRIGFTIAAIVHQQWQPMAVGLGVAEVLGIFEELVDKR